MSKISDRLNIIETLSDDKNDNHNTLFVDVDLSNISTPYKVTSILSIKLVLNLFHYH